MCKQIGNRFCTELGEDSALWSKHAPLQKPQWVDEAFLTFSKVLKFVQEEKTDEAKLLLKTSRDLEMREWFDVHAQNSGGWRNKALGIPAPDPILPLDSVKTFGKFEDIIFARDDLKCRYCSSSLLTKKVFKRANAALGDEALPLGKTNATRSGFYLMFVATLDHVLPWSLGGRTDASNLVTCCWSCNYGKANYTVEQLGMTNPIRRFHLNSDNV